VSTPSTVPQVSPPTSEPTGHTPGPWYAYSIILDGVHAGYRYGIANAKPCGITEDEDGCRQVDFPDWNAGSRIIAKTMDSDTARDDARLIAAAPDLLAACKALMNTGLICTSGTTTDGRPCNCTCDVHPELLAVIDFARAAIAKAGGAL